MLALHSATPTAGIHLQLPERVYHLRDLASLSSSGARRLWWSGITPCQFRYEQLHGAPDTEALEFGRAVHTMALGSGPLVVRLEFRDWKSKRAQALRRWHRQAGRIPLLHRTFDKAQAMAAAVRTHPALVPLLSEGWQEVSFYWPDPLTGLMLRARPDWLHPSVDGGVVVVDLKTTDSADPEDFAWSVLRYGYHLQQDWYQQGIAGCGLVVRHFLFAAVSKHAPHVVSVCELHPSDIAEAAEENRRAVNLFARCVGTDTWPDHGPGIHRIRLPRRANLRLRH
ncbi:PD-(D/E)XK nuclease-like domain-containing protein [Nocardia abscessus]|uniref:PD-(D/E)XK nuclease-like domain-containing protein n=1 Tax=Nocardia abscessus TaxID=120957 RepID=UPI0018937FA9|nr:PD-(D/E)XK nuclease-like domain-containing protein [Nocardia abscessus]MBF6341277.1 PD-(D/E)XK nuclease-like domain-containing protein [Nocardia abscessus]